MRKRFSLTSLKPATIMGVLNVTPDSFSDGGKFNNTDRAMNTALRMENQGAGIIDIGGESTRPGAQAVSVEDELARVIPVIESIRQKSDIPISIDTSKPEVMSAAINAGASMINDVNALRAKGAIQVAAEAQVPVCIMHMQGNPRSMQTNPSYDDVTNDVIDFLLGRADECVSAGINEREIALDPGFGFGKTVQHNYALFASLPRLLKLGYPVLVGVSRKSMIGAVTDKSTEQRLAGSIAAATIAAEMGAHIIRVHDVDETVDAVKVVGAIQQAKSQIEE